MWETYEVGILFNANRVENGCLVFEWNQFKANPPFNNNPPFNHKSPYVENVYSALKTKMPILHVLYILFCNDNYYFHAYAVYLHGGPFVNFLSFKV